MNIQTHFKSGAMELKEWFQKPQVQKALKITAIAVATLAAMAGTICIGLFIAAPVVFLSIPIALSGIAIAIFVGMKGSIEPRPIQDPVLMARVNEVHRHAAEVKEAVQEAPNVLQNDSEQKYIALADHIAKEKEALMRILSESPEKSMLQATFMKSRVNSIVSFIDLTRIMGAEVKVTHLAEHRVLIQNLREIADAAKKTLESNPGVSKKVLEALLKEIDAFVMRYP